MLGVPLVDVLQSESCAILAIAAFFLGGFDAIRRFQSGDDLRSTTQFEILYLLAPLGLYELARLIGPGCDPLAGLMYFVLFPVISVVLAVAVAYALTARKPTKAVPRFFVLGFLLLLSTLAWDLGLHPQFYVYNHVFGGVLGPIYDLDQTVRPGLFVFRAMTLLWSGILVLIGFRLRHPEKQRFADAGLYVLVAILGAAYVFGPQLGINTTYGTIADGLGSSIRTDHFEIVYDARVLPEPEVERIAADHEFRYAQMAKELGFGVDGPILSFIYPTARIRAQLTGAGYTDIAPVWLGRPQVHVLYDSYDRTFVHELAHVFSRSMGLPILHASLRVGLVEGFAVAMEPPIGLPDATDQVAAIRNSPEFDSLYGGQTLASRVVASLTPFGFWTDRGAVSYTTMGSFVRYLLDKYGPKPFLQVYGMASFESAYGVHLTELAQGWEASLIGRELPPAVADLAASRFSVLSIFERRCPHDTPEAVRRYWDALDDMQFRDTTSARVAIEDVLRLYPDFSPALAIWAQLELQRGVGQPVAYRLNPVLSADSTAAAYLGLPMGDALAMDGRSVEAVTWYDRAARWQSPFSRTTLAILRLRPLLASQPDLIAAANRAGGREGAIGKLASSDDAAARIVGALMAALDFDYATAQRVLASTSETEAANLAGSRWPAWAALFAYRTGDFDEAERFRQMAVQVARLEQDPYEIARLEDFGVRIEWARRKGES